MTVATYNNKTNKLILQTGITQYPFNFEVLLLNPDEEKAKQAILVKGQYTINGEEHTIDLPRQNYSVTLNNDGSGGYINLTEDGYNILHIDDHDYDKQSKIIIYRQYDIDQESDYENYNTFPAETLESNLDKLTMIAQQLEEKTTRALILDEFSDVTQEEATQAALTVANNINAINNVNDNITDINSLADRASEIDEISQHLTEIDINAINIESIQTVANNMDSVISNDVNMQNINTLAEDIENIDTVAENISDINLISDNIDAVSMNAEYIGAINTNAENIDVIRTAEENALRAEAAARSVDPENLVHISGEETITGVKTFKRGEGEEAERIKLIGDGETGVTSGGINISGYDKNGAAIGRINFGTPSASLGKMIRFEVLNNAETAINYFALINNPDDTVEVAASGSVKSAITNWGFPGGTVFNLTPPPKNTAVDYAITRDGYFTLSIIKSSGDGTVFCNIVSSNLTSTSQSTSNLEMFMPVRKGTSVRVIWGTFGSWTGYFSFLREVVAIGG